MVWKPILLISLRLKSRLIKRQQNLNWLFTQIYKDICVSMNYDLCSCEPKTIWKRPNKDIKAFTENRTLNSNQQIGLFKNFTEGTKNQTQTSIQKRPKRFTIFLNITAISQIVLRLINLRIPIISE